MPPVDSGVVAATEKVAVEHRKRGYARSQNELRAGKLVLLARRYDARSALRCAGETPYTVPWVSPNP